MISVRISCQNIVLNICMNLLGIFSRLSRKNTYFIKFVYNQIQLIYKGIFIFNYIHTLYILSYKMLNIN